MEERSRDRENREIASALPMGRQAFDSFKRELDLEERNAALLREMVADPGGAAHVRRLQNLDAFRLEDPAARRSAFGREIVGEEGGAALLDARADQVEALKLRLQDVVPEFGPQAAPRSERPLPGRGAFSEEELDPPGGGFGVGRAEGPGASKFDLSPDEEALFASPSSEMFLPERLIELMGVMRTPGRTLTPADLDFLDRFSNEDHQRALKIWELESSGLGVDQAKAATLRNGAPLDHETEPISAGLGAVGPGSNRLFGAAGGVLGALGEGGRIFAEALGESHARDSAGREAAEGIVLGGLQEFGGALVREDVKALEAQIERDEFNVLMSSAAFSWAGDEGGGLWTRFSDEIDELTDLSSAEAIERWHQAILGGTSGTPFVFNPWAALEGLAGNRTYRGKDHWLARRLPEDLRDPLGEIIEDLLDPPVLLGSAATVIGLLTPPGWVAISVAVVGAAGAFLLNDLSNDDPASTRLLEALVDHAGELLEQIDPDGRIRRSLPFQTGESFGVPGLR